MGCLFLSKTQSFQLLDVVGVNMIATIFQNRSHVVSSANSVNWWLRYDLENVIESTNLIYEQFYSVLHFFKCVPAM
ncbi:hypothetical protein B1R32_10112 [Abditibacterium utsteinense]|uniref:Uncharacterized protein n=1 Tax=Abditibacterium utsteinense TaxID=1960156 RepID=A0A2S8SWU7_9BACT|nr:hypothetical protein B1R32_10112 [Abditibacterium utsteinense]